MRHSSLQGPSKRPGRHEEKRSRKSFHSVKSMSRAAEYVAHLVADQFLDLRPCWPKIFSRIEFLWVLRESVAQSGSHRQTQVGVDIHFRATDAPGDFNVRLGHPGRVRAELATVLVNLFDQIFRHARSAVQHQGIIT